MKYVIIFFIFLMCSIVGFAQDAPCVEHARANAWFFRTLPNPVLPEYIIESGQFIRDKGDPVFFFWGQSIREQDISSISATENDKCRQLIDLAFIQAKVEMRKKFPRWYEKIGGMERPSIGFRMGIFINPGNYHPIIGLYNMSRESPEILVGLIPDSSDRTTELTWQTIVHEMLHYIINFLPLKEKDSDKAREWVEKFW